MSAALRTRVVLLVPSTAVFLLVFVVPLVYLFLVSFWRVSGNALEPAATLDNYARVFGNYSDSLLFTFGISALIAAIVTLLSFGFAYVLRFKAGRHGLALLFVPLITLFGGYLTKIYAWKTILGQAGILNSALIALGVIDEPIPYFLYNPVAVVITLGHYTLPLAILPIYGALRGIDDLPLLAARDLGAGRWRIFRDMVLPQARLGLVVAFTLTFLFAAGDYVTPALVGGPHTSMIGVFIQSQFGLRFNPPLGAASAFTVIALCIVVVAFVALLVRQGLRAR